MKLAFQEMDLRSALQIVDWEYPAPYEVYNLHGSPLALAKFLEGSYFSVRLQDELVGFFCYGRSAQLLGKRDNPLYQSRHLDIGLGLHPSWCGRGLGVTFVRSGLVFARSFWSGGFRLTVASNNPRAMKVYSRLGFQEAGRIAWSADASVDFLVMILDNFEPSGVESPAD